MPNNNSQSGDTNNEKLFETVKNIAENFNGKSNKDLLLAIYREAKKGKENGTLSNNDIDNFGTMIAPFLDDKEKKILVKVIEGLKNI